MKSINQYITQTLASGTAKRLGVGLSAAVIAWAGLGVSTVAAGEYVRGIDTSARHIRLADSSPQNGHMEKKKHEKSGHHKKDGHHMDKKKHEKSGHHREKWCEDDERWHKKKHGPHKKEWDRCHKKNGHHKKDGHHMDKKKHHDDRKGHMEKKGHGNRDGHNGMRNGPDKM